MSKSTLSQVLNAFEDTCGPMTMKEIAGSLDISIPRLEGMIQYWVRKGKLRETINISDCGTCGRGPGDCPFTMELPRTYELVTEDSMAIPLTAVDSPCGYKQ